MKLDDELAVAHRLADAAREAIRPHFREVSPEFKGDASQLTELVVTDTIPAAEAAKDAKRIRYLTIAPLIGEAVRRIADESSVSSLFD